MTNHRHPEGTEPTRCGLRSRTHSSWTYGPCGTRQNIKIGPFNIPLPAPVPTPSPAYVLLSVRKQPNVIQRACPCKQAIIHSAGIFVHDQRHRSHTSPMPRAPHSRLLDLCQAQQRLVRANHQLLLFTVYVPFAALLWGIRNPPPTSSKTWLDRATNDSASLST